MRRGAQMKLLLTQRAPRAASRGESIPYSIVQARIRKFAADATCAPRASREENLPYSIAQGHQRKFAADAACGPRGEQGRKHPLLDCAGPHKEICC